MARKFIVAGTLICAAGLIFFQIRKAETVHSDNSKLKQSAVFVSSDKHSLPPATDKEARLKLLEAENLALSNSLAEAEARNAQLAEAFKEIAGEAAAGDPTNRFPTARHVYAGLGSFMRKAAAMNASEADFANMPLDQIKAMQEESISMLDDLSAMMKASQQFESERAKSGPKDWADDSACLLFGALALNEQQFTQAYGIIQQLQAQARAQNLWDTEPSAVNQAAIAAWNDQARKQIQGILNPDQRELFQKLSTELLDAFRMENNPLVASLQSNKPE